MIVIGQKNGFFGRSLLLIVVLSAIVPSLQDIGSNAHPDLPFLRSRLSVFLALVVLGGETWAVGRVQAGICPEFKGGGVGLILKLNLEFYIGFEHSHHSNFYF